MEISLEEVFAAMRAYRAVCIVLPYGVLPLSLVGALEWVYRPLRRSYPWLTWVRNAAWYSTAMANGVGLWLLLNGL